MAFAAICFVKANRRAFIAATVVSSLASRDDDNRQRMFGGLHHREDTCAIVIDGA
jgi:hypothetical protein